MLCFCERAKLSVSYSVLYLTGAGCYAPSPVHCRQICHRLSYKHAPQELQMNGFGGMHMCICGMHSCESAWWWHVHSSTFCFRIFSNANVISEPNTRTHKHIGTPVQNITLRVFALPATGSLLTDCWSHCANHIASKLIWCPFNILRVC